MIVYGYVKQYMYDGTGSLNIQVRVPSIHGPFDQSTYGSSGVTKNYTRDEDLPYYQSVLLPHLPNEGEVVMLSSINEKSTEFVVIGLTGGSFYSGATNIE